VLRLRCVVFARIIRGVPPLLLEEAVMLVRRIFETSWVVRKLPVALRYGLATLIVICFVGLRWLMDDLLEPAPFLLFFPAVLLIALLLDHGSAIYASFLSVFLSAFLFIPPYFSLAIADARHA